MPEKKIYATKIVQKMKHTSDTPYIVSVNLFVFRITKDKQKIVYDRMHYVYFVKLLKSKKLLIT